MRHYRFHIQNLLVFLMCVCNDRYRSPQRRRSGQGSKPRIEAGIRGTGPAPRSGAPEEPERWANPSRNINAAGRRRAAARRARRAVDGRRRQRGVLTGALTRAGGGRGVLTRGVLTRGVLTRGVLRRARTLHREPGRSEAGRAIVTARGPLRSTHRVGDSDPRRPGPGEQEATRTRRTRSPGATMVRRVRHAWDASSRLWRTDGRCGTYWRLGLEA